MVRKKPVFENPIIIQYRGTYDYDGLIAFLRGYLLGLKPNVYAEPKFKYKTGKTGAEVEFQFKAIRRITHYIRIELSVAGHAWDVIRRDIEVDGQKKMVTDGKIHMELKGNFEVDFANAFGKVPKNEKFALRQMEAILNKEPGGVLFEDNKVTGKKFATSVLNDLDKKIKSFLRMECF